MPAPFASFNTKVEAPAILKHPHYIATGRIKADGYYDITCEARANGLQRNFTGRFRRVTNAKGRREVRNIAGDEIPIDSEDVTCGPLDVELRAWDRDDLGNIVQKSQSSVQDVRRDLDAVAGINVYRDGFRVLPYGEPLDDSFRLDRRRVQNPTLRLSNNQIYGTVSISADNNCELRDQSNREGMQQNAAFDDFRDIMWFILGQLEAVRYAAKRPQTSGEPAKRAVGGLFSGIDLKPLADYIESLRPQDREARELIARTQGALDNKLKEIQTVLARYQRLATLGQLIDHVLHEGRQPVASIINESQLGLADTGSGGSGDVKLTKKLHARFSTIERQGDVLATAFRRMEPFGGRRRGKPNQMYLEDIIRDAFELFSSDISRAGVRTELPKTQTLVRVDPSEIQEVIVNLLQNSLYWLEQANTNQRHIAVTVERIAQEHVNILFSDSGPGIPLDNREAIFDPYFSTKPEGIGLGLSIVGEIVTDYYGGTLQLLSSGPLNGANFMITLRKRV